MTTITSFERREYKKGHGYFINEKKVPGVTTIINKFVPKPKLVNWAVGQAGSFAQANIEELAKSPGTVAENIKANALVKRDVAQEAGSEQHLLFELIMTGGKAEIPEQYIDNFSQIKLWLDVFKPKPLHVESAIAHCELLYAGTLDLIAEIDGEVWLLDLKTGKGIYNEVALQLTAYAKATHIEVEPGVLEDMPHIDRLGVVHVNNGKLQFCEVKEDARLWDLFQNGLYFSKWNSKKFEDIFTEK